MSRRRARRLYAKALWFELRAWSHDNAATRLKKRAARHEAKEAHFEDLADRYDLLSREARNEH